jgi:hypothetical protein
MVCLHSFNNGRQGISSRPVGHIEICPSRKIKNDNASNLQDAWKLLQASKQKKLNSFLILNTDTYTNQLWIANKTKTNESSYIETPLSKFMQKYKLS